MKILQSRDEYLDYMKSVLPPNPKVLEVGVEAGHFSKKLMKVLDPSELHLLDPWETNRFNGKAYSEKHLRGIPTAYSTQSMQSQIEARYKKEIQEGRVKIHRGYSHDLAPIFETEYFDFVYLDGCHLYESVKQDLIDYIEKVNPDGVLGGHDYISQETTFVQGGFEYSNQLGYGIKRAVDEFLEERTSLELFALVSGDIPFPDWAVRRAK